MSWYHYGAIEKFGEDRQDARAAFIVRALYNINRDAKKQPRPFELNQLLYDFLQELEEIEAAPKTQTWQEQKHVAKAIVAAFAKVKKNG